MIAVDGDGVETLVGHETEAVSVGPDGSVIKVQTDDVTHELIEAGDVQEVDVRDMRLAIFLTIALKTATTILSKLELL